ncbi:hypothetical protein KI387_026412 [Taxus chinensis]|uniref:DUF4283 domain-containing protein n=1 Tax=Taxus chinensis TaxID=29808 RepID=A0AA38L8L3_TAXCH|nr:hypothetical protein KI387_026412 [Taxus chinensis]
MTSKIKLLRDFNLNTLLITKMHVWVRVPNLPMHLCYALEDIGNVLGRFIKEDMDRTHLGLYTYAHIYVEIDLTKGLLDHINLKFGNFQHSQVLDYENMAFRCRSYRNPGHLQASCPLNKNPKSVKKGGSTSFGSSGFPDPDLVYVSSFKEEPRKSNSEDKDAKIVGKENMDIAIGMKKNNVVVGGTKRGHIYDKSDSNQDFLSDNVVALINPSDLMVVVSSDNGKWQEVKKTKSKKGHMSSIEDYFPSKGGK